MPVAVSTGQLYGRNTSHIHYSHQ